MNRLYRKFWAIVHNAIAHPLMATESEWSYRFHDWTAEKAWGGSQ